MPEMTIAARQFRVRWATPIAIAVLCFAGLATAAADDGGGEAPFSGAIAPQPADRGPIRALNSGRVLPGMPMVLDPDLLDLPFNVGGSDSRKLQLHLTSPLTLEAGSGSVSGSRADTSVLGLDASLRLPVTGRLSFAGEVRQSLAEERFHPLGSIHCDNGTLRADSYTASGCRFVNEQTAQFDRRTLSMGPQLALDNLSASLRWFTTDAEYEANPVAGRDSWRKALWFDPGLSALTTGNTLLPGLLSSSPLSGETSGIDLDFELGFTTDQAGAIRLGLALTRVYNASFEGLHSGVANPFQWNVAEPFNTATLGLEWSRGPFSGGLMGHYQEPVSFLDHGNLDSMGTFDVHFTWRTPWNANLSVGASNVLSAGGEARGAADDEPADRFESIYGRIPYVRYQQDL